MPVLQETFQESQETQKELNFNVLSDLHLDFWTEKTNKLTSELRNALDSVLDSSEDVPLLICAGDLTHYVHQLELLEHIAKEYNYEKVICVLGNHELYLISTNQRLKYNRDSKNKFQAYLDYAKNSDILEILDGTTYTYRGVKFGGAMGWYSGEYLKPKEAPVFHDVTIQHWKETMNDSVHIYGMGDFYNIYHSELPKIKKVLSENPPVQVMITHVCPSISTTAQQKFYVKSNMTKYYCFDSSTLNVPKECEHWIYGHSHGHHTFVLPEHTQCRCTMNAIGYRSEHLDLPRVQISVKPYETEQKDDKIPEEEHKEHKEQKG